jgi:hypothetical protein
MWDLVEGKRARRCTLRQGRVYIGSSWVRKDISSLPASKDPVLLKRPGKKSLAFSVLGVQNNTESFKSKITTYLSVLPIFPGHILSSGKDRSTGPKIPVETRPESMRLLIYLP